MPFSSLAALASSLDADGKTWTSWAYKSGGPASFDAGRWGDLSMGAGVPKYNAYVGSQFEATQRFGAGNDGIYLGPTPGAGETKHLAGLMVQSSSTTLAPAVLVLCDYLLFYPLIDGDDTAQQDMVMRLSFHTWDALQAVDGYEVVDACPCAAWRQSLELGVQALDAVPAGQGAHAGDGSVLERVSAADGADVTHSRGSLCSSSTWPTDLFPIANRTIIARRTHSARDTPSALAASVARSSSAWGNGSSTLTSDRSRLGRPPACFFRRALIAASGRTRCSPSPRPRILERAVGAPSSEPRPNCASHDATTHPLLRRRAPRRRC